MERALRIRSRPRLRSRGLAVPASTRIAMLRSITSRANSSSIPARPAQQRFHRPSRATRPSLYRSPATPSRSCFEDNSDPHQQTLARRPPPAHTAHRRVLPKYAPELNEIEPSHDLRPITSPTRPSRTSPPSTKPSMTPSSISTASASPVRCHARAWRSEDAALASIGLYDDVALDATLCRYLNRIGDAVGALAVMFGFYDGATGRSAIHAPRFDRNGEKLRRIDRDNPLPSLSAEDDPVVVFTISLFIAVNILYDRFSVNGGPNGLSLEPLTTANLLTDTGSAAIFTCNQDADRAPLDSAKKRLFAALRNISSARSRCNAACST